MKKKKEYPVYQDRGSEYQSVQKKKKGKRKSFYKTVPHYLHSTQMHIQYNFKLLLSKRVQGAVGL